MKYRVKLDLPFNNETDAKALFNYAKRLFSKASNINEGLDNEEIAFVRYELCGHDEGMPCQIIDNMKLRMAKSNIR